MLAGLGFNVIGWARSAKSLPGVECYAGDAERDAFLRRSDILVCLLPDTPETRGAIRAETIALLPRGARFAGYADAARGKSYAKRALQTRTGLHADTSVRSCTVLPTAMSHCISHVP